MHEETRFAIFVPGVVRKDLQELPTLVSTALREARAAKGIPSPSGMDPASAIITRADIRLRAVLGCMNELALHCRLFIEAQGGLAYHDQAALRRSLNDILLKGKDGRYGTGLDRVSQWGRTPGAMSAGEGQAEDAS
jgi:hypothetical protein